jgi:flagellar protein FliO/FliZ
MVHKLALLSMSSLSPITSVIRWLLVVVGCAVLATAQPMSAANEAESPTRTPETILYPKGTTTAPSTSLPVETNQNWILVMAFLLALGGAWVLIQRRRGVNVTGSASKKLAIEETRALGNRQYLVVASYEGQKFLVGVTPGQIQMLAPLVAHEPEIDVP